MGFDPILWSKLKALQEDVANIVSGSIPEGYIPTGINEYDTKTDFPRPGSSGALYIAKNTNLVYRWTGAEYILVGLNSETAAYSAGKGIEISDSNEISIEPTLLETIEALQSAVAQINPEGYTVKQVITETFQAAMQAESTAEEAKTVAETAQNAVAEVTTWSTF